MYIIYVYVYVCVCCVVYIGTTGLQWKVTRREEGEEVLDQRKKMSGSTQKDVPQRKLVGKRFELYISLIPLKRRVFVSVCVCVFGEALFNWNRNSEI